MRTLKLSAMWKVETDWWRKAGRKPTTHLVHTESQASASVLAFVDVVVFACTVTVAAGAGGVILAAAAAAISAH